MTITVVFVPDSFKGSASATAAAAALAAGWASVRPSDTLVTLPMADGGEGTSDVIATAVPDARRVPVTVEGPDGRAVSTSWLQLSDGTGIIDLASTSGLTLLESPTPLASHTYGFGQAIAAALDAGVHSLVLALGGSASTDGGAGMLQALGMQLLDAYGRAIPRGNVGLHRIATIDSSRMAPLPPGGVTVLCDVNYPLLGPLGAAAVFGPQKGASVQQVAYLETGLSVLARCLSSVDATTPGTGAAGGAAFGLLAWGAELVSGSTAVAGIIRLPEALSAADVVVTGEGSFDSQSAAGKVVSQVLHVATGRGCQVMLAAGRIDASTEQFLAAASLTDLAGSATRALSDATHWLTAAGAQLATRFSETHDSTHIRMVSAVE